MLLRIFGKETHYKFMWLRRASFPLSGLLVVASLLLFGIVGMNFGIDFRGGTLIEIQTTDGPADLGEIRTQLSGLGLGDVQVQEFGAPNDVLIRVEEQPGGERAQQAVVTLVQSALGEDVDYRRVEVVGPRVSQELVQSGFLAVLAAIVAVLIYIWVRFEWQYAVGAIIATVHDVILTIGVFSLLQLEFNLSSIAAILTIVGYSLNDTVVVYDRIRELLRRYKAMPLPELLDLAINQMLSRTAMTSVTTLLALLSLYIFGGEVIRSFTFAMIWGVIIGTYSSIFIAAPILIYLNLRAPKSAEAEGSSTSRRMSAGRPGPGYLPRQALLDAYGGGGFRFADMSHRGSLLALPGGMMAWAASAPEDLTEAAFRPVLEWTSLPDLLLIGSGIDLVPLDATVKFILTGRGMAVDVMATGAAARTYNVLLGEGRSVGAALLAVD